MDVDVAVVGGGVVGLAIAGRLAGEGRSVALLERREATGRETSTHNSGVIHAGIYYPPGSLKHRLCLEGNPALYAWCAAHGVTAQRTGKLIVALHDDELPALDALAHRARENDVPGVERLDAVEARALEPAVPAAGALLSTTTGAVDAAALVRALEAEARAAGVLLALRHDVRAARREAAGFALELCDADGAASTLRAGALVNAAGHGAPALGASLGYPLDAAEAASPPLLQRPNRGRYYDIVGGPFAHAVRRHIYPLPEHRAGGLGVHLTVDVDGALHLGPDTEWLDEDTPLDYRADDTRRQDFLAAGRRLLPGLRDEDIAPGQVGYRPKLQRPGEDQADFLVWADRGYVHLGGIESPGLTASLPLAGLVADLVAGRRAGVA